MLDIIIDKLTECIEEVETGRRLNTEIRAATFHDIRKLKDKWHFDSRKELQQHEVYLLTIPQVGAEIQGLISLVRSPGFVDVKLLESRPANVGRKKKFAGIPGNLMAYAARLSFQLGFDGFLAFDAKTALIDHYTKSLGAQQIGRSNRMVIETEEAQVLIERYFGEK